MSFEPAVSSLTTLHTEIAPTAFADLPGDITCVLDAREFRCLFGSPSDRTGG